MVSGKRGYHRMVRCASGMPGVRASGAKIASAKAKISTRDLAVSNRDHQASALGRACAASPLRTHLGRFSRILARTCAAPPLRAAASLSRSRTRAARFAPQRLPAAPYLLLRAAQHRAGGCVAWREKMRHAARVAARAAYFIARALARAASWRRISENGDVAAKMSDGDQ